jgi:predicted O-methyltransferase YrrM
LSIIQQVRTIPLYVHYFLKVADQHSLQAPFIFEFYSKIRRGMKDNDGIEEIENVRKLYLRDNSKVFGNDFGAGSRAAKSMRGKSVASIARHGISSRKDCIFLSELVKKNQPETCIELGTSLGIATSYLARSTKHGYVYTFEGNNSLVQKAKNVLGQLNCENVKIIDGDIDEKLPEQLDRIERVDFAIIDANHTYEALLHYFNLLQGKMKDSGIMVIDDIRWSVDMYRAWKKIISSEEVNASIEFLNKGVLLFEKHLQKQHYILSY